MIKRYIPADERKKNPGFFSILSGFKKFENQFRVTLLLIGILLHVPAISAQDYDLENSFYLDFAVYTGKSFSVKPHIFKSRATDFRPNGKRFYVVARRSGNIAQYDLSNAWDISTASFSGGLDISGQLGVEGDQIYYAANGIYIRKTDGKKLWVMNRTEIWEYDLNNAWDISSARNPKYTVLSQVQRGHDFDFSPDGRYLYVDDRIDDNVIGDVHQYRLSTAWDVSSQSYEGKTSALDETVRGVQLTSDGSRMFLLYTDSQYIAEYKLGSDFDIRTKTAKEEDRKRFPVDRADEPTGMTFSPDFTRFYISDEENDRIYQYKIQIVHAGRSEVESNTQKVVANGSATARIDVTARDRDGDTISGVRISLNADGGNADIDAVRNTTNNSGVATFDVSHDEQETITLRASGMGINIDETVDVRFVTVDPDESSIAINREKVLANGSASATVTVVARDEDGDPLQGVNFTLTASGEADVDIDNSNRRTNSDGQATFEVTSTSYGTATFHAEGFGVELAESVSVRFVDVDPDESELIADNNGKILANGQAEGYITVIARDEDGDELEGAPVRLRADSDHPDIERATIVTNNDGEAEFTIRSNRAETVTFSATSTGNTLSQTATIRFVTVDPDQTIIAVNPENVQADGEEVSTITVTTRDEDGDILPGARVELEALNGTSAIDNDSRITDDEGNAQFRVTNHQPQIVRYKITAENIELPDEVQVGFIPIAPVALSANSVETRTFRANWEMVEGAEHYLIDVATDSSFSNILANYNAHNTGNTTSYEIENVSPGTTYMYRVRAASDGLIGANSQTITTTTFPDTPVAAEASERNALQFTANWNEAEGAQSYRLDVAAGPDFETLLSGYDDLDVGADTQYTITGLAPGTRYFYRVRSVAGPRTSGSSEAREAITLTISSQQSGIESEQLRVLANGTQPNAISIVVKSDEGVLLQDLEVNFVAVEGNAQIEPVQPITNEEGEAVFNVTSSAAGEAVFHVSVAGIELGQISVEFLADSGVLELGNNYPNPFLFDTTLPVTVPRPMHLHLQVFNALGAPIRTVVDEELDTGYYEIPFRGDGLAAGVYFYRLTADGKIMTEKMIMVK